MWPAVIAHRGASGHALENSRAAFTLAVAMGCDGVELDVHASRDGELIVHHDPAFADGVRIRDLTAGEIAARPLSDGTPPPTLAEALALLVGLDVYVEVKELGPEHDDRVLTLFDAHPEPDRLHVHAFDHRIVARLVGRRPGLSAGVLSTSYPLDPVAPVLAAGARTLWQEWHLIDAALVERCRAAGIDVIAWTVNARPAVEALAAMGVRGVCGNWPEVLGAKYRK